MSDSGLETLQDKLGRARRLDVVLPAASNLLRIKVLIQVERGQGATTATV